MTFDEVCDAFASDTGRAAAFAEARIHWDTHVARLAQVLRAYAHGVDLSERSEQALSCIVPLLSEHRYSASFADLCLLGGDTDRLFSALGEDGAALTLPSALVSTFGGDLAPLQRLIEAPAADPDTRCDALQALAYLTYLGKVPDNAAYAYLSGLPARLPAEPGPVWLGYAVAVGALGFAGLSAAVESLFARGLVDPAMMQSPDFWHDLRFTQQNGRDLTDVRWSAFEPIDDAEQHVALIHDMDESLDETSPSVSPAVAPLRNPLRTVGRNDPCPCGSGKKFKKCCLQPAGTAGWSG